MELLANQESKINDKKLSEILFKPSVAKLVNQKALLDILIVIYTRISLATFQLFASRKYRFFKR